MWRVPSSASTPGRKVFSAWTARIPETDSASRMLFHRNQSPFCEAPKTENEPACSALAAKPPRIVGLYPADVQSDPKFCEALAKAPNAAELMDHFSVVVPGEKPGTYRAVPYTRSVSRRHGEHREGAGSCGRGPRRR